MRGEWGWFCIHKFHCQKQHAYCWATTERPTHHVHPALCPSLQHLPLPSETLSSLFQAWPYHAVEWVPNYSSFDPDSYGWTVQKAAVIPGKCIHYADANKIKREWLKSLSIFALGGWVGTGKVIWLKKIHKHSHELSDAEDRRSRSSLLNANATLCMYPNSVLWIFSWFVTEHSLNAVIQTDYHRASIFRDPSGIVAIAADRITVISSPCKMHWCCNRNLHSRNLAVVTASV